MKIKKYIVDDMKEALVRAKYELGEDAVIISQQEVKQGMWFEFWKKPKLEVTLAIEDKKKEEDKQDKVVIKKEEVTKVRTEEEKELENKEIIEEILKLNPIFRDMREFRREQILGYMKLNLKTNNLFSVDEVSDFVRSIYKKNCFDEKLDDIQVTILVGPTGVGKTTTIAKIAAKEHLIEKKSVGLITMDTYRIGAVEQLKTYANILGLPFEVAMKPEELKEKIENLRHCDLILIDTLGTSQKNDSKIEDIEKYLSFIEEEVNILLAVSMSTNKEIMTSILDNYRRLNYTGIVLTKFDEIVNYENFWNMLELNKYPVQYFCYGQDVPEDISDATLENLISYSEEIYEYDGSSK